MQGFSTVDECSDFETLWITNGPIHLECEHVEIWKLSDIWQKHDTRPHLHPHKDVLQSQDEQPILQISKSHFTLNTYQSGPQVWGTQ